MLGEGSWKFVQIRAIRLICVPSCHARHGYTDDTDLLNETRPAGGPSRESVQIRAIRPICVPTLHAR